VVSRTLRSPGPHRPGVIIPFSVHHLPCCASATARLPSGTCLHCDDTGWVFATRARWRMGFENCQLGESVQPPLGLPKFVPDSCPGKRIRVVDTPVVRPKSTPHPRAFWMGRDIEMGCGSCSAMFFRVTDVAPSPSGKSSEQITSNWGPLRLRLGQLSVIPAL
jgi:hypothetical protein